jgi:Ca2+-binding RTX toxin-like protein
MRAIVRRARIPALVAMAATSLVWMASPASAASGTVSRLNGVVRFVADGEVANNLTVEFKLIGNMITFTDTAGPVRNTSPDCQQLAPNQVRCSAGGDSVQINVGDLADTVTMKVDNSISAGGATGRAVQVAGAGGNDRFEVAYQSSSLGLSGGLVRATYDGGANIDTISYASGPMGVSASADNIVGDGPDGADNIAMTVENIIGSRGNDTIRGSAVANDLDGGLGNDTVHGLAGNDIVRGGSGVDTLDGGADADELRGSYGADSLRGGAGIDTVFYDYPDTIKAPSNGLDVTMGDGLANDGHVYTTRGGCGLITTPPCSEGDNIATDVENVNGTPQRDHIAGNALANTLRGLAGKDVLEGGAGFDTLDGGTENDACAGGAGGATYISCEAIGPEE